MPDFQVLKDAINQLDKQYKGTDTKRLESIQRIQDITRYCTTAESLPVLEGLLLFSLDEIAAEYSIGSPQEKKLGIIIADSSLDLLLKKTISPQTLNRFFSTGSTLDTLIRQALGLANNPIDKYHKLLSLTKFYTFVEKNCSHYQLSPTSLSNAVAACQPELDILTNKRLAAHIVKQNFSQIAEKYAKLNGQKKGREAFLAFIRTVDKKLQCSDEVVSNYSFNNTIRHAVIIHIMEELEAEYTISSDLYQLCQQAINLSHTKELSTLDKYNYYSALHAFVPKINPNAEEPCSWLVSPIPNANHFLSAVTGKLLRKMSTAYEALENNHLYPTLDSLRHLINMAMGFGIGIAIGSVAGGLVTLSAEQKIFSRFISSIAKSRYGMVGELVIGRGAMIVEQAAVTTVVAKSLRTATNYVAHVPGDAVYYTLSVPANIAVAIQKMLAALPERKFYESIEFINAVITLPDQLFSAAKKHKLSQIELYHPDITPEQHAPKATLKLSRSMSL
jgi:hypothetical protein